MVNITIQSVTTKSTGNNLSNNFKTGSNPSQGSNPENKEIENLLRAGLTLEDLTKENIKPRPEGGYSYAHQCLNGTYPQHKRYKKNIPEQLSDSYPRVIRTPDFELLAAKKEGKDLAKYVNPRSNFEKAKDGEILYKKLSKCETRFITDPLSNNAARTQFKGDYLNVNWNYSKLLVICESFNDAAALGANKIPAFSASGIQNFAKISTEIKEYITQVNPDLIILLFDSDITQPKINPKSNVVNFDRGNREAVEKAIKLYMDYLDKNEIKSKVEARILNTSKKDVIDNLKEVIANGLQADHFLKKILSKDPDLKYCDVIRGTKTTISTQLNKLFGANYLEAYKKHQKQIRDKRFKFKGAIYEPKQSGNNQSEDLFTQIQKGINTDPEYFFKVDTSHLESEELYSIKQKLVITKYITEKPSELKNFIESCDIGFIQTPTGSGKTSAFTGFKDSITGKLNKGLIQSKEYKNKKMVISVPSVQLAQQISNDTGIPAIYEGCNPFGKKNNIKAVISTYDSLYKIPFDPDLFILDEAHNLIAAANYRSEALNLALNYGMKAKKFLLLSATMPDQLFNIAKELKPDAKINWIEFARLQSNKVFLHFVEASAKEDDQIAKAIKVIKKVNQENPSEGVISIFWNDTKGSEKLKEALRFEGINKEGIVLINKKHLNDSEATKQALNEIKHKSEIQTPEILIHTCLIQEGININNQNIKAVILINNRDASAAIQAINRYRKQDINVYDIRQKERDVKTGKNAFSLNADIQFRTKVNIAKVYLDNYNLHKNKFREDQESEDLEYISDYENLDSTIYQLDYPYLQIINSEPSINYLEIAHEEYKRIQDSGNNAFYLTQMLKAGNIYFKGYCNLDAIENKEPLTDCIDQSENEVIEKLKNDLIHRFKDVRDALFWHYKVNRNTDKKNEIKFYLPDSAEELEGIELEPEYYQSNQIFFKTAKYYNRFIKDWMFLKWMGYDSDKILQIFDENQNKINKLKTNWIIWSAAKVYADRNTRKLLNNIGARSRSQTFIKIIKYLQRAKNDPNLQKEIFLNQLIKDLKIYLGYYDLINSKAIQKQKESQRNPDFDNDENLLEFSDQLTRRDKDKPVDYLANENYIFKDSELKFIIQQFAEGTIKEYLTGTTIKLSGEIKQGAFLDSPIGGKHRNFLAYSYKFNDLEHFKNME